jgi:hypothetical protein
VSTEHPAAARVTTESPALEGSRPAVSLDRLACGELMELFRTLPAPSLEELDGEYATRLLAQPMPLLRQVYGALIYNPMLGTWLGKAFNGRQTGQGYNYFRRRGRVVRSLPMLTCVAPSRFDGKPAFQLVYRAFHSLCADVHMVDEIRRVGPGLYLGIGTAGFIRAQRLRPMPFELTGPQSPYAGDIGRPRDGFDLQRALIP